MKYRYLLFICLLAGVQMVSAQRLVRHPGKPVTPNHLLQPAPARMAATGLETQPATTPAIPLANNTLRSTLEEEVAGNTTYDLQSNGSESARLYVWPSGEVSAVWPFSSSADGSGWPDRGTAYNRRTDWLQNIQPTARIEANNLRTGFPSYGVTADGAELIVCHRSKAGGGFQLHSLRRTGGAGAWTEADIPTVVPKGKLWGKMAIDGNTVHVIAISTPPGGATFGDLYRGMSGHLLYSRSKDGGLSWDITDGIIPGIDSTAFAQIQADKYCIDARDGTVAIGIFDSWNDAQVFKSTDGGDTWGTPFTIWDFPLVKYVTDKGYTTADLGGADPNAPDSLAIFTTDGSASILIDLLGYVHVWVGETYVLDNNLADGGSSYYPGINGLLYWNELNPEELREITFSRDWNNNDTLDITGTLLGYGTGLSSMPTSASDQFGNLYLAYSANVENLNDFLDQNYKHVYTMKSPDLGVTWSDPVDVHYLAAAGMDSIIADLSEGVWPMAFKKADGAFHFTYQRDFTPGSAVQLTGEQDGLSDMVYLAHSDIVGTKAPAAPALELSAFPNPAGQQLQIGFDLPASGRTVIELIDPMGRVAYRSAPENLPAGRQLRTLQLGALPSGLYVLRLQSGGQMGVRKVLVRQ